MPEHNGSKPPIPFHGPQAGIPILGQPYELKCVIPTVMAVCTCGAKEALLLIGLGATAKCPACRRVFVMREFEGSAATGKMSATLEVGVEREVPKA